MKTERISNSLRRRPWKRYVLCTMRGCSKHEAQRRRDGESPDVAYICQWLVVGRRLAGRPFHRCGPATAELLSPTLPWSCWKRSRDVVDGARRRVECRRSQVRCGGITTATFQLLAIRLSSMELSWSSLNDLYRRDATVVIQTGGSRVEQNLHACQSRLFRSKYIVCVDAVQDGR